MSDQKVERYTVEVFGESYSLVSDEGEGSVVQAAHQVDTLMQEISEKLHGASAKRVAVLAALTLAHRLTAQDRRLQRLCSIVSNSSPVAYQ